MILEKLGKTLESYLLERNRAFSLKTVCQIGIKLIDILMVIHDLGYLYNDLKLDNVVIGDHNSSSNSLHQIKLVDFGLATRYLNE